MSYCVVISWPNDDQDTWVFGPYDHDPTEAEITAAQALFMKDTETSDADWSETGCWIRAQPLNQPPA